MKSNFLIISLILIFNFVIIPISISYEQFNFDVTEVEIKDEGNRFIGKKRGRITTNDGVILDADEFEYDKKLNILNASGNVKINDTVKKTIIYTNEITYLKNTEIIFTEGDSKALEDGLTIYADNFRYNKILNIINADGNVKIDNPIDPRMINDIDANTSNLINAELT